MLLLAILRASH